MLLKLLAMFRRNSNNQRNAVEKRVIISRSFHMHSITTSLGHQRGSVYPGADHRELQLTIPKDISPSILGFPSLIKLEYKLRIALDVQSPVDTPSEHQELKIHTNEDSASKESTLNKNDVGAQDKTVSSSVFYDDVTSISPMSPVSIMSTTAINTSRALVKFPVIIGTRRGVSVNGHSQLSHHRQRTNSTSQLTTTSRARPALSDTSSIKERVRRSKVVSVLLDRTWSLRSRSSSITSSHYAASSNGI